MLKKSILALSILSTMALLLSFKRPQKQQVLRTVIIDAGHGIMSGGGYNGAKGNYSYEDDICLSVSKKLVAYINKEFPEIKVIETRPDKYIVPLHERADI